MKTLYMLPIMYKINSILYLIQIYIRLSVKSILNSHLQKKIIINNKYKNLV